jgi:ribonuclease P protein component
VRGAPKAASGSACRFGLGPQRRLAGRGTFERLLRQGERRSISGYTFYVARRSEGPPRLGILISREHAAKATERNSLKRCVREAFRLEQARIGSRDVLVRPPYGARPGPAMIARLRELLGRLGR